MQTVSVTLETALLAHETGTNSFDLIELIEVYSSSYVPHVTNGYEPASAEKRWCGILGYTFLTLAYEREYIDRGDVQRYFGKQENNCTLNFSNISRQLAAWVQGTEIEGKQVVVRVVSSTSTVLADSLVIFTGRLDKPGDFDDESGSLTATQRFGQINQQFPPRTFSPHDPNGRAPNDPLFEGFRFQPAQGSLQYTTRVRRSGFGGLLGLSKTITHSLQYSSHANFEADLAVPDAFGRVQLPHIFLGTIDKGNEIASVLAFSEGVIDSYVNFRQNNPKFTQPPAAGTIHRYGYLANEGVGLRKQEPTGAGPNGYPGDGFYSRTAWIATVVRGSTVDLDESEAPDFSVVIKGKIIPLPDGSGVFNTEGWSDNPAYIARYVLSDTRYFNEGAAAIEDPVCWATALHCADFVLDSTKGEWTFVPQADAALHGTEFTLFRSTGLVDSRRVRMMDLGSMAGDPILLIGDIEPFDPTDPPEPGDPPTNPNLRPTVLRVRHTTNVTITEKMSGLDFLYNVLAPTGRLFFRRNGKGRIEIHTEKPADNTRVRVSSAPSATTIAVTDVDPWKTGLLLTQKLLIGNTLLTSEVRVVTAANFTSDGNSITLSSSGSGGITATASGANLTGGSSSVAASGTVTLGGTAGAGAVVNVTINGFLCAYVLDSFDSLGSAAVLVSRYINANPTVHQFAKASASGNVVTITSKWGVLTLNTALANAHSAEVQSPLSGPVLAAAGGGVLVAGTWAVRHAYRTAIGSTRISPDTIVVLTANQQINVTGLGSLPAGVLSVDWYVSKFAGSTELVFWGNNDGSAFSIGTSSLPVSSNNLPPDYNESGEETLRVAKSFGSNDQGAVVLAQSGLTKGNIHKGTFKWPLPGKQSSTNLVTGTFFDSTEDYAPTPLEVHDYGHQTQIRKINKKEYDLSGFDNYSQSSRYLNFQLSRNREGDWFDSFSTEPSAMLLEEGDIICASSDNGGLINVVTRIEELSIGPAPTFTTKITGRKYSTLMFSDRVRQHSIKLPTVLRSITPIPSAIEFIDNFPIRDVDGLSPGFYIAVSFDKSVFGSWRGWQLWADYGDGYAKISEGDVPAVMGTATTTLATPADPSVWDRTSSLTFTAQKGLNENDAQPFSTLTEQEILANGRRNLFLVGNEYLQAATVVDNGSQSYTISTLLRGRFGTDTTELTHSSSERVIYLNGAEKFVGINVTRLNGSFNYKAVTVNQDVADATAIPFTWTGGNLRPLSPVNLRGTRDSEGSLLIQWTRRSRLSPGMSPGSDVPLAEEAENYDVEILTAGNVLKRTMPVAAGGARPAILVDSSQIHADRISANNILANEGGAAYATAFLNQSGSFVEATLKAPDGFADMLLVPASSVAVWNTTGLFDPTYRAFLSFSNVGSPTGLTVVENGITQFTSGSLGSVNVARVRILISGTEVRYYWDYTGPGSVPFFISTRPPPLPLAAAFVAIGLTASIENVIIANHKNPSVMYSAPQQVEDFGSVQNPIRARVYQISSVVGRGPFAQADL